jgi:hypothetical protein
MEESMTGGGHVFVVQGDLTKLECDAVLVPTDVTGHVEGYWGSWAEGPIPERDPEAKRVTASREIGGQIVRFVDVGATMATADVQWLREGLNDALAATARDLAEPGFEPRHGRARPLLAMPVLGVGKGGFDSVRGEALTTLLEESLRAAAHGFDIAIACLRRSDYAALQSRRPYDWSDLPTDQAAEADGLGERGVRRGSVALFLGAGVSKAAGLPDWAQLLADVAGDAGEDLPDRGAVDDLTRVASKIRRALGQAEFEGLLRQHLTADKYAVAHALVASMRIEEVVTTNVDNLYEQACETAFGPGELCVLPWNRMPRRTPWLLKLHGDLIAGSLVFTREDYDHFREDHGVLGAVVQSLLMTRNLVFVGYSMRDRDFLALARQVAEALARAGVEDRRIGTVLSLRPPDDHSQVATVGEVKVIVVGGANAGPVAEGARRLEIFLDRMAWSAAKAETSWVLDDHYRSLLSDQDRRVVESLRALSLEGPTWSPLREALARYGAVDDGPPPLSVVD